MDWGIFFAENGATIGWMLVAIAAAAIESLTCDLVSIWFVPGAIGALLLSLFVDGVWWQIGLFLVLSVLTLVLMKTVFKKYLPQNAPKTKTNVDALIGTHGVVTEEINNLAETGSVKVRAMIWTARSTEDSVIIPANTIVTICDISGVKLLCKPQDTSETK